MRPVVKAPPMPRVFRHALVSVRDLAVTAGPFVLLALAMLALAFWFLDPTPPRRVVLLTGPDQSAFDAFGQRYRIALKRHGIELELRATAGSVANLRELSDAASPAVFGFAQGGTTSLEQSESQGLHSLGSLFYEPVWIFYRESVAIERTGSAALDQLGRLAQWRVNVGTEGSGGPLLFQRLLQANQLAADAIDARNLEPSQAVAQLLEGELDAVVLPQAAESPLVQMLLQTPGIRLFDFSQAEAYARRLSFLSHVILPRGIVALGRDLPAQDYHLVSTTATLVAREGAHPALVRLMVQAAADIHGGASWFRRAGEFPNAMYSEIPVADEAIRHYRNGRPLLQQYLPFWVANLIDRMWVVLTVIVAMLLPLSRIVPPIYQFRVRSRIFRWYAQLRRIEEDAGKPHADRQALASELDALEARVEQIAVPLSYADELYSLRSNIGLVRSRLK